MSHVGTSVEWAFGKIINNFAFLDLKKNQKILLQPVGKFYIVVALLTNCHTCLYPCQTSEYFEIDPPTKINKILKIFFVLVIIVQFSLLDSKVHLS